MDSFYISQIKQPYLLPFLKCTSNITQELLILPEHLSSPPVLRWVRVTRSLVLCVCFVDRWLSFCPFSFGHCVACSSSIYGFWLPQTFLKPIVKLLRYTNRVLRLYFTTRRLCSLDLENINYCYLAMYYDGHVCYLIFMWWLWLSPIFNITNIGHMTTCVSRKWSDYVLAGLYAVYAGLYMYWLWKSSYQERVVRIQLTGLSPLYLYPCLKTELRCPIAYVVDYLCSVGSVKRWFFGLLILVELIAICV